MGDLSLMSSTVSGAQTLLSRCITALNWAGVEFRADKSRCIVIVKGSSMNTTPFSVSKASDQPDVSSWIPSIHSRPINFLRRIIDGSISDRNSSAELTDKLLAGLSVIDKSHFTGTQTLWILQHVLIPRIQWPLLIYEIPISLAFKLEQKVSVFIRKWLHLHHSTSSLSFYSSVSPCPLPIKSLSSALKASKISGHLLLRSSQDPLVLGCILDSKLALGRLKMLFCLAKVTLKSIRSVERAIITGTGLHTPPHEKFLDTNLQNITGDIFQNTTNQLMTPMPSPKLSNCRFRVSGQDG